MMNIEQERLNMPKYKTLLELARISAPKNWTFSLGVLTALTLVTDDKETKLLVSSVMLELVRENSKDPDFMSNTLAVIKDLHKFSEEDMDRLIMMVNIDHG